MIIMVTAPASHAHRTPAPSAAGLAAAGGVWHGQWLLLAEPGAGGFWLRCHGYSGLSEDYWKDAGAGD